MNDTVWQYWGASATGPSHLRRDLPNQDSWMAKRFPWGEVVVVADGLGSRRRSDLGSRAACMSVIETAKTMARHSTTQQALMLRLIHANWQINTAPFEINDCLTTCLFVIRMQGMCHIGQLGDGMIAVCGETGAESLLINDEKEDSFSNVTQSLGLPHNPEEWRFHVIPENSCKAVVLCSDGISDDLRPEKQIDFAESVWQEYSSVSYQNRTWSVNSWLKNWPVPFHSDDKTIACLYRK